MHTLDLQLGQANRLEPRLDKEYGRRRAALRRAEKGAIAVRPRANHEGAPEVDKLRPRQRIDLLQDMDPEEICRLLEGAQMRKYERRDVIAHPDDPPDTICLIKEGRVKLCGYSASGRVQIVALLERGDIFGEQALVGAPAMVHSEAFEDTLIYVLRRQDFEEQIQSKPELAMRVVKVLVARLIQAEEAIANLALRDVPERLAVVLTRLGEVHGEPHLSGRRLALRVTHHDLASMIGTTRETVTIVLNRFRDEGLITAENRHIVICDMESLAARGSVVLVPA